jgi:hypothetical protein
MVLGVQLCHHRTGACMRNVEWHLHCWQLCTCSQALHSLGFACWVTWGPAAVQHWRGGGGGWLVQLAGGKRKPHNLVLDGGGMVTTCTMCAVCRGTCYAQVAADDPA